MNAVVVIPWWDGGVESRRQNLRCVMRWYTNQGLEVILGDGSNRATSKNNGARQAQADVLVFADADLLAEGDLGRAIDTANETHQLVYPYNQLVRLDENETRQIWAGGAPRFRGAKRGEAGLMAIRKDAFLEIGGFPDIPAAGEDTIFYVKAEALLGPVIHQRARAVHLWHEGQIALGPDDPLNLHVPRLYIAAQGRPEAVRGLMEHHG